MNRATFMMSPSGGGNFMENEPITAITCTVLSNMPTEMADIRIILV